MFEALSKQARMKMSRVMKAKSKVIALKRKIAMNRKAPPEKLKKRAMKKAREILLKKILKDRDKNDLSFGMKQEIEKKLDKKKAVIKRIAKRLLPSIKKTEQERMAKKGEK